MCIINSQMPEFKVNAYRKGKGFFEVSNEDLKGKWSIFFFYPGDFTFVCPTELADLADHYEEFQALGVDIFSVSTDSHFVHKAWADATKTIERVPYMVIVGEKEAADGLVSMRCQGGGEQATMRMDEFAKRVNDEVAGMLEVTNIHPQD